MDKSVQDELRRLEECLLDPAIRGTPDTLDRILAQDFVEFGQSGRIYDKTTVIAELLEAPGFSSPRTITDFEARELAHSVVLVTYRIAETGTLRSSVWRHGDGGWQLAFHQGTPAPQA